MDSARIWGRKDVLSLHTFRVYNPFPLRLGCVLSSSCLSCSRAVRSGISWSSKVACFQHRVTTSQSLVALQSSCCSAACWSLTRLAAAEAQRAGVEYNHLFPRLLSFSSHFECHFQGEASVNTYYAFRKDAVPFFFTQRCEMTAVSWSLASFLLSLCLWAELTALGGCWEL